MDSKVVNGYRVRAIVSDDPLHPEDFWVRYVVQQLPPGKKLYMESVPGTFESHEHALRVAMEAGTAHASSLPTSEDTSGG